MSYLRETAASHAEITQDMGQELNKVDFISQQKAFSVVCSEWVPSHVMSLWCYLGW